MLAVILMTAFLNTGAYADEPPAASAPSACSAVAPREVECDPWSDDPKSYRSGTESGDGRTACRDLANCVCGLLGSSSCQNMEQAVRALQRGRLAFDEQTAREARRMVDYSRDNSVNDDLSLFTLPYHSRVASEFGAFIIERTTDFRNYQSILGSLHACYQLRDSAAGHTFNGGDPFQSPVAKVLTGMDPLFQDIADEGERRWRMALRDWTGQLLCTFRHGGFENNPLLEQWPSECACGNGGRGVQLTAAHNGGPFCLESEPSPDHPDRIPSDDFARAPIDAKVPAKIRDAIGLFSRKLGGAYQVSRMGLDGCTMLRMKTTKDMYARTQAGRALLDDDISDHGRGTACDVTSIEVRCPVTDTNCPGGSRRWSMIGPNKARPFRDALRKYMAISQHDPDFDFKGNRQNSSQQDQTFCHIEEYIDSHGDGGDLVGSGQGKMSREEWEEFKMGVYAERAFRKAGMSVETPFTNDEHYTHFHIEIAAHGDNTPAPCRSSGGHR